MCVQCAYYVHVRVLGTNKDLNCAKNNLTLRIKKQSGTDATSVAEPEMEPEPVEPKLLGTWSRSQSRN